MPVTINTNMASVNALTNLNRTTRPLGDTFAKLSSGLRITKSSDDAAGLGMAENLKATGMSLRQASRNVNDGVSFLQTAESYVNEVGTILKRMKELATQSASGTLGSTERAYVETEFVQMRSEIDRIRDSAEFNGVKLANGSTTQISVQVGAKNATDNRITITLQNVGSSALSIDTVSLGSETAAQAALTTLDTALNTVNSLRSTFGATQNQLESVQRSLETYTDNVVAAESRIRDADFAYESAQLSRYQIMQQAGVAVLGQANQLNQSALQLLR
jgi:flagellin